MRRISKKLIPTLLIGAFLPILAFAREVTYKGDEVTVYVKPGESTQIEFPSRVEGGYKNKQSSLKLEKRDNYIVVFPMPDISMDGETLVVYLDDKRSYSIRLMPSSDSNQRDPTIRMNDLRDPEPTEDMATADSAKFGKNFSKAPSNSVPGLVREMTLYSEFGKTKPIPGFKRSNRYTGETVLDDGTLVATIDEIFMGSTLWGYVLTVENRLSTSQRINPASFRIDGTRAISAQRWELSGRPITSEDAVASQHKAKVYIVAKARRN